MTVHIVTDSTADIPSEICEKYGIEVVPLSVHFGAESFKDGVELDSDGFWTKLQSSPHHPKTAQPSPGDFLEVYQRLYQPGDEILSIHISSKLSGTVGSANIAAQMMPTANIVVIDTLSATLGLGLLSIRAAQMARDGKTALEIAQWVQETAGRMHILFTLDTLSFLEKNGRIGKAQSLLGGLLGIKPILQLDRDGAVAPLDKVRGKSRVIPRTMQIALELVPAGRKIRLAVLHAQAPDQAQVWLAEMQKCYQVEEYLVAPLGAVIATHTGPGTIGVVFHEV